MTQSQKDSIKKIFALMIRIIILISLGIFLLNIFFDINKFLLVGAIVFFIIFLIFGIILVILEVSSDNDKELDKIINKWIKSEKTDKSSSNLICPICGQPLLLDAKYCTNCGSGLKKE